MAISAAQYTAWLLDNTAVRCILVEVVVRVASVETTRYLSSTGYVTTALDTPANTDYIPIISGNVTFTESLGIKSTSSLSFGGITLTNANGDYDNWLDDIWVNRQIQVFIGDVRWARADFRQIFDGITDDLSSTSLTTLIIGTRDKLQRLNTPIIDTVLGGTTVNKDKLLPVCLGECFNVTPLLSNGSTLEYQVHNLAIEDIIEVRDEGVPVSITKNIASGKFTLTQSPAGTITASIQGSKPTTYDNTVSLLVQRLATSYGKASEQFIAADLDATNLASFNTANPQPVGIYFDSRTNVLDGINKLASSVGAQAIMSRAGTLRLLKIELPPIGIVTNITTDDIVENSLKIKERTKVVSTIKLGYNKNYTVQSSLETGIPEDNKALYSEIWVDRSVTDVTVATNYKLDAEPVRKETQLLVESDADTEATRLLTLYKVPRTVYMFKGGINLIELELGGRINLTHTRFGLTAGVDMMVTSIQINWVNFTVNIEAIA